ncbi:MAG TPA: lysophospholipid acyltransferase family protein [Caulobacteraceae bacterium]|nr:lysophospholipid acyltransferase family protein [Caulobacteraceae bacterium]
MNALRLAFLVFLAAPLARFLTGADVIGRERLPTKGPAIIAANHNSHIDTLLLLTIFPAKTMSRLRPAAAADYFLKGPMIGWFSRKLVGIVPIARDRAMSGEDVLRPAREALEHDDIIIIFPEGTRGDASDEMGRLRHGVARLAEAFPDAPVTPVWLEGAGRVLPKGAHVPVPMNCTVLVGEPIRWGGERTEFMDALREALLALRAQAPPQHWAQPD